MSVSTELQISAPEYMSDTVLKDQAPAMNHDFSMQVQFQTPLPNKDSELLRKCENATMLSEMAPSGGSFASDLFGMACDAFSVNTADAGMHFQDSGRLEQPQATFIDPRLEPAPALMPPPNMMG